MAKDCRNGREPASGKTGKIFLIIIIIIFQTNHFCLLKYHIHTCTTPVAFIVKFWSTSIEMISTDTMKEDSLNN